MFFLVLATDRPGSLDHRLAHRQLHLDYWTGHTGTVKVAGAMLDGSNPKGSAFLLEVDDRSTLDALIAGDPFTTAGVFGEVRIEAFRPVIGDWKPA